MPAAVLVPLVDRPEGLTVLLTQRTAHLEHHAGQISFPGGRAEEHDRSPVETALREAEEEIGLHRRSVREIAGFLDLYQTVTGFLVTPVVGFVEPPLDLTLDAFEVAEA
ncbi:MAG: CoA pyrophosphatase, partial [Candidatus Competibacteraceae bacterium]|nr:CoA pyrophosphatase [Candidatus Competibacteraceae bacterium]